MEAILTKGPMTVSVNAEVTRSRAVKKRKAVPLWVDATFSVKLGSPVGLVRIC